MADFFSEIILGFIGYHVGYFVLRFFSGGKYPAEYLKDGGDFKIELFGIFILLILLGIITYIFI